MDEKPTFLESLILQTAKCPTYGPHRLREGQKWHSSGSIPYDLRELREGITEAEAGLPFAVQALSTGLFYLALEGSWQ